MNKLPNANQKRPFDEKLPFILAFALPILIMLGIFAGKQIFPFGDNCFLRTDLYHQYVAFFRDLRLRLREGQSLTYAFNIGLGSNYSALYAYYLCSPLHMLAFLVPEGYIIEFITGLIVLKIGLCGLTMAWYLSRRFDTRHLGITFCGICFALSGYMAAYSWNIMWLDVLWLTPIIMYALEKLVTDNKPYLYCLTLALAILCNYYISIMLCIFLVFYFITRMIVLGKKSFRQILLRLFNFGFYSIIAGAMACILIVPAAYALMTTASADSTFPKTVSNYFSILEMLARHLVVVDVETGLDHWPNLYSGVGVFLCVPFYFMNREVNYKEKIVNTCLLGFMLLGYNTNVLNYIWHGLHYPNSLPCRQSFLYTFVLMIMCFEGIRALPKLTKGKVLGTMWGSIILILIIETVADPEEIPYYACYASIAFIALYTLFIYLNKTRKAGPLTASALALCVLVVEMGLNTAVTSVSFVNRKSFVRYDQSYAELTKIAEDGALPANNGFTRIERYSIRTKNDGPYLGYNSASIFSSTTNASISDIYKKLGMEGNTNAYSYTGATPLVSSLLSVQYKIAEEQLPDSELYTYVAEAKDTYDKPNYLYRYNYTLPLGYLVPIDTGELWTTSASNPIKVQNGFINVTTGVSNILTTAESHTEGAVLEATVKTDGHYTVYVSGTSVKKVTASVNDKSRTWDNINRGYLADLGSCRAGDTIRVTAAEVSSMSATLYYFDTEKFKEAYDILNSHPLEISEITNTLRDTRISGTVTADQASTLMLSLPYEKGWTAFVDDHEVETAAIGDAFLSFNVTAGTHSVKLVYSPEGLALGAKISLAAVVLFALTVLIDYIRRTRKKLSEETKRNESTAEERRDSLMERTRKLHELDNEEYSRTQDNINREADTRITETAQPEAPQETLIDIPVFVQKNGPASAPAEEELPNFTADMISDQPVDESILTPEIEERIYRLLDQEDGISRLLDQMNDSQNSVKGE